MSTGNFHGQPLAFAGDMLAMAVAELGSISERRVYRLLDPATSRGLPPFLARAAGTNSGFMLAQYTAASLVAEDKVLAHPAGVDTIPTSGNQEDHVSMGWHAARKAGEVLDNVATVLAVEVLCAAQAIDLRADAGRARPGRRGRARGGPRGGPADGRRPRGDRPDRAGAGAAARPRRGRRGVTGPLA